MDDVFQAAVDSLLELFGSDARIVSGSRKIDVRCSPMFSSKLGNEKAGARISEFSANVIVAGKEHSNTATAYRLLDEWKTKHSSTTKALPDFANFTKSDVYNDFEAPISIVCPSVKEHLSILGSFSPIVCAMSGSGSAVFALFETEAEAIKAQSAFSVGAFVCKLL